MSDDEVEHHSLQSAKASKPSMKYSGKARIAQNALDALRRSRGKLIPKEQPTEETTFPSKKWIRPHKLDINKWVRPSDSNNNQSSDFKHGKEQINVQNKTSMLSRPIFNRVGANKLVLAPKNEIQVSLRQDVEDESTNELDSDKIAGGNDVETVRGNSNQQEIAECFNQPKQTALIKSGWNKLSLNGTVNLVSSDNHEAKSEIDEHKKIPTVTRPIFNRVGVNKLVLIRKLECKSSQGEIPERDTKNEADKQKFETVDCESKELETAKAVILLDQPSMIKSGWNKLSLKGKIEKASFSLKRRLDGNFVSVCQDQVKRKKLNNSVSPSVSQDGRCPLNFYTKDEKVPDGDIVRNLKCKYNNYVCDTGVPDKIGVLDSMNPEEVKSSDVQASPEIRRRLDCKPNHRKSKNKVFIRDVNSSLQEKSDFSKEAKCSYVKPSPKNEMLYFSGESFYRSKRQAKLVPIAPSKLVKATSSKVLIRVKQDDSAKEVLSSP